MNEKKLSALSGEQTFCAVVGNYIRLGDGMPDCDVEVIEATLDAQQIVGNKVTLKEGDSVKFIGTFTRVSIKQSSGAAVLVSFIAGFGELSANRIASSVVISQNAEPREVARCALGKTYVGGQEILAPGALNYGVMWLQNTTGFDLLLENMDIAGEPGAVDVTYRVYLMPGPGGTPGSFTLVNGRNMISGLYTGAPVLGPMINAGTHTTYIFLVAVARVIGAYKVGYEGVKMFEKAPLILKPDQYIVIAAQSLNKGFICNMAAREL